MSDALRVLVVEDSPVDAKLIAAALRQTGRAIVIERVDTAVAMRGALASGAWDVITCDWAMPGFGGRAALALLKDTGLDIPFIIVSGTVSEELAVDAMRAGAHDYVIKDRLTRLAPAIERELRDVATRAAQREADAALLASEARCRQAEIDALLARVDRIGARVMRAFTERSPRTTQAAQVLDILAEEAGYRPLAFYEYDEWQGGLVLRAGLGLAPSFAVHPFKVGEGLVGEAAASQQPRFMDSSLGSAYALDTGVGVLEPATIFALPLMYRERLLGVIAGASREKLPDRDRSWLTQVAGQVAIGLHALQQFEELQTLSRQLNERSHQIEAQNQELAAASRLKSEFLASMSHELRTPLNAIIGFSEVLIDGLVGELPADQLDYIGEVYRSGHHLLSLINDILDLSKIEAGKMELELETILLEPVIANAFAIMRERATKGNVTLRCTIAPELVSILADGRKFRQIVYNLLSNAVKFTPQGGGVELELTSQGAMVELAVIDSGIGIAEAKLARLFRPFEQLDSGLARRFEGTGLGLVMVKNLVELHAGTFGVESEPGKGSRFWVRLPCAPPPSAAIAATAIASPP